MTKQTFTVSLAMSVPVTGEVSIQASSRQEALELALEGYRLWTEGGRVPPGFEDFSDACMDVCWYDADDMRITEISDEEGEFILGEVDDSNVFQVRRRILGEYK